MNTHLDIPNGEFEAYIFDCDGTLADSMPAHHAAWSYALKKNGAQFEFPWKLCYELAGVGLHDTVRFLNTRFEENLDPDQIVVDQAHKFNQLHHLIKPIQPVLDIAIKYRKMLPIAVASGGLQESVLKTLKTIGALELFDVIISKNNVKNSKPAPDTFLLAAEKMNVNPKKCLVFEDSPLGIEAAKRAGMQWCYVDPKHFSSGANVD